ncbi:hypothetical protein HUT18_19960 [Streptomyces sp. NA04227]|uniref:hypothetical protein n=1 Tax=Streptomyces sp. NA04227 TaxID=2742136 RepID=UPI0015913B46|nr:hypothetical protein [Streptomyces sp. NA04227]QKW08307.1 hypothetical protein HUT18_19960 [Streptomyces sp. NA04227]
MTLTHETPLRDRVRGTYSVRLTAHTPGGLRIPLGEHRTNSPRAALRWLHARAQHLADQLAPHYAHPVQSWAADAEEHAWALGCVALGEPYLFCARDEDGTRYVFTAQTSTYQLPSPARKFPSISTTWGRGVMRLVK